MDMMCFQLITLLLFTSVCALPYNDLLQQPLTTISDTLSVVALAEAYNIPIPESIAYAAALGIDIHGPIPDDAVRVRLLANGTEMVDVSNNAENADLEEGPFA